MCASHSLHTNTQAHTLSAEQTQKTKSCRLLHSFAYPIEHSLFMMYCMPEQITVIHNAYGRRTLSSSTPILFALPFRFRCRFRSNRREEGGGRVVQLKTYQPNCFDSSVKWRLIRNWKILTLQHT